MKRGLARGLALTLMMVMTVLVSFCVTGTMAYAAPAASKSAYRGKGGECPSCPGDTLLTLDYLQEKQAKASSGRLRYTSARTTASNGTETETSIPLLILVVGFEGASEHAPKGVPYNTEYDWGNTVFSGEKSIMKYYYDMSLGKFTFLPAKETSAYGVDGNTNTADTVNDGVIHVSIPNAHGVWMNNEVMDYKSMQAAWIAAIEASSAYIDYAAYDTDGSGDITTDEMALGFVIAGEETSAASDTREVFPDISLWAHASSISELSIRGKLPEKYPEPDGIQVNNYIAISEYLVDYDDQEHAVQKQGLKGTIAHELGHYLGLPDLYDTSYADYEEWSEYEVGYLSLMAMGNWGLDEDGNAAMYSLDPISRFALGWISPEDITENGVYTLTGSDEDSECKDMYFLPSANEGEGYLLENHAFTGWDSGMRQMYGYYATEAPDQRMYPDGGIVLWHFDINEWSEHLKTNTVNNSDHRPALMPLFPERESDETTTLIRRKKGGRVVPIPFMDAALLSWRFPELANGFRLPAYGREEEADTLDGRFDSCTYVRILSDAGEEMQVEVLLDLHTPAEEAVIENKVEPSGKKEGGYDVVHYCEVCGREADRTHVTIPKLKTGWQKQSGKWYYYDAKGVKLTGWQKLGGKWYYLGNDGARQTGWIKSGRKWYYMSTLGVMQTDWVKHGGKWYYLGTDGAMKTGWGKYDGQWYFFSSDGAMKTGWLSWQKNWYYFGSDGIMVTGTKRIGNVTYHFSSGGICLNP